MNEQRKFMQALQVNWASASKGKGVMLMIAMEGHYKIHFIQYGGPDLSKSKIDAALHAQALLDDALSAGGLLSKAA